MNNVKLNVCLLKSRGHAVLGLEHVLRDVALVRSPVGEKFSANIWIGANAAHVKFG